MRKRAFLTGGMIVVSASSCALRGGDPLADGLAVVYRCESGREVAAAYPTDSTAVVRYEGKEYEMRIAISASGARYVGGGHEWWTRGTGPGATGRLGRFTGQEQTASETLESCSLPSDP